MPILSPSQALYSWILVVWLCSTGYAQPDSLVHKLNQASVDEKIEIYKTLVTKYINQNGNQALKYALAGLELSKNKPDKTTGFFYLNLGILYRTKSSYDTARMYYQKGIDLSKKMKSPLGVAKFQQNMGVLAIHQGNYTEGVDYYLKALKVYEELHEKDLTVGLLNNMGTLYSCRLGEHEKALTYYQKGLAISNESPYKSILLMNMGEVYMRQKKWSQASQNMHTAIQYAEKEQDNRIIIASLSNLANISLELKLLSKALLYSKRSLDIQQKSGMVQGTSSEYLRLAEIYDQLHHKDSTAFYYQQALTQAQETQNPLKLQSIYESLHPYYARQKDFGKSYDYLLKLNQLNDSLFPLETAKQLEELQAKFDLDKKQKELILLKKENQIKSLENQRQGNTQRFLIVGLVAAAGVLSALFYGYRGKQKANMILEEKNQKIAEALHEREILLKEVHHRVKNNLQIISSLLSLQNKFSENKSPSDILHQSQDKIQAMAIIHEKLYQSQDLSSINLKTYLDSLLEYFKTSYQLTDKNISIHTAIDAIALDMDHLVPCGLIINEILTNSIKYAFPDHKQGNIHIQAVQKQEQCVLTIQDDGIGFSKTFQPSEAQSLGLRLIHGLTRQIKGYVAISSATGVSYTITFQV